MDPMVSPTDCAACARSWDLLEERLRILNNRLKPGSWNVSQPANAIKRAKKTGENIVDVQAVARLMESE